MSKTNPQDENETKEEQVRVVVRKGYAYCEDEFARTRIHQGGKELLIPRSRLNHTVELLDKPAEPPPAPKIASEQTADPEKNKPQHRMIESPRGGGRKS